MKTALAIIGVEVVMAASVMLAGLLGFNGTAYAVMQLPACQYEDGNTDGLPCWWTDPDTGNSFYVTSENYR